MTPLNITIMLLKPMATPLAFKGMLSQIEAQHKALAVKNNPPKKKTIYKAIKGIVLKNNMPPKRMKFKSTPIIIGKRLLDMRSDKFVKIGPPIATPKNIDVIIIGAIASGI